MSTAEKKLASVPVRRKISVKSVKLSDQKPGYTFRGIYRGQVDGKPFQKVTASGEIVTSHIVNVILEDLESGDRTAYVADKGLTEGLANAMVNEGDKIECVKLEKTSISKSRTMNQYDIFSLG